MVVGGVGEGWNLPVSITLLSSPSSSPPPAPPVSISVATQMIEGHIHMCT